WATVSGWLAASSAASTMRLISCGSMCVLLREAGGDSVRRAVVGDGVVVFVELAGELQRRPVLAGQGQRLDVDRRQRRLLHHVEQTLLGQLEDREEGHDHAQTPLAGLEQLLEAVEGAVPEPLQQFAHALA